MHKYHLKSKALAFGITLVLFTSLAFASPHSSKPKDTKDQITAKQELKEKILKKAKKKHKANNHEAKTEEVVKAPEIKKEIAPPAPPTPPPAPAPLTPDKKKYGTPNGYQIMTDGTVVNFRSTGVIFMHGYRYSYYSSKVLYHHKTHEWYACDDHIYRTADGYIVVASGTHPMGAIVPTPFGKGKVLDSCYVHGTIDIYVDF